MVRRVSTATAVSECWDPHEDESDGTSNRSYHSQVRRHSLTESETSKQSNNPQDTEVQSTKSLKQVTWSQAQNLEADPADVNAWNKEQLDVELNKCAALTVKETSDDQSTRCPETSVVGEADGNVSQEDLEDAVKRCTKIAELLNQRLREQQDTQFVTQTATIRLPERCAGHIEDARPDGREHFQQAPASKRPQSVPPGRGPRVQQRRAQSANPLRRGNGVELPHAVEEELSPRAMQGLPGQKPLSTWSVEDVYRWTLQVASCPLDVAERLRHQAVNGLVLASLTEEDLENMGVTKFGWRRQLVLLARCLREKAPTPQAFPQMPRPRNEAMPFHSSAVLPPKHGMGGSRMLLPFWNAPVTRSTLPPHFKPWWVPPNQFLVRRQ